MLGQEQETWCDASVGMVVRVNGHVSQSCFSTSRLYMLLPYKARKNYIFTWNNSTIYYTSYNVHDDYCIL